MREYGLVLESSEEASVYPLVAAGGKPFSSLGTSARVRRRYYIALCCRAGWLDNCLNSSNVTLCLEGDETTMIRSVESSPVEFLLRLLDEAYNKQSWHGPNLRGALRGINHQTAAWRPSSNRHNIWEITVHAAYWKYVVRRRLLEAKRGSFEVAGSNWFRRPAELTATAWKSDLGILERAHHELRKAVASLSVDDLGLRPGGSQFKHESLVRGVAFHDIYHAGQIQLLKRLIRDTLRR